MGTTIEEVVKKEHFDIAVKKVSVGNCILTLKAISRINFLEIFEKINRVEDILKQDPAKQYEKMDSTTKSYYRNAIQEISKKTKISEIYIAKKCLELSLQASEKPEANEKSMHIGFYLISDGKETLLNSLLEKKITLKSNEEKAKIYIETVWGVSLLLTLILSINFYYMLWYKSFGDVARNFIGNIPILVKVLLSIILALVSILPIENIVSKIIQYVLSKVIKPKLIPKIDFQNGITKLNKAMFDTFQNNIAKELTVNSSDISIGTIYKIGRLVVLSISYTASISNIASNTAKTLITLAEAYRPGKLIVGQAVIKDIAYKPLNNSYIQIRPTGAVEMYQNSGSTQNVAQVLATLVYVAAS